MKTLIVILERKYIQAVPVAVPDWWDAETALSRLSQPEPLDDLDCIADPDGWEQADEPCWIAKVANPSEPTLPIIVFGEDELPPPHPDQGNLLP